MEEALNNPTSEAPQRRKTGPKPKELITVEVTGYEVGRGVRRKVVFDADVFKLAALGCNNKEIAQWFDVDEGTLEYNFRDIMRKGREELKQSLRRAQIKLALSGNAVMLIWLGKNILGQSDTPVNGEANQPLPWSDNESTASL
jgi:hypothetical protein